MTYSKSDHHYNEQEFQQSPNMIIDENFVPNAENQLANIPEFHNGPPPDNGDDDDDSILLWKPNPDRIDDHAVDMFVRQAFDYGINGDGALHLLYVCNYDNNVALNLIRNTIVSIF
ncbi:uncharacterized protein LOC124490607 isoform X2 [Dermatophagoides farinae]|uniref:ELM2 domain-containing protein n=1 Tax=Dermatophagoides farinae TaxID=6954 RepID=A0A922I5L8_DERFA|nr:uncharacterized protein LOC124490607 isoform X2 [Dermatophagoides farinae]KAH9521795.1 hypothetical protein DERF_005423 [Dermatophagoides farinae]